MTNRKTTKKDEETYSLTFKGLLHTKFTESVAQDLIDHLELYMRRNGYNAIILHDEYGGFLFSQVELAEDK